MQQIGTASVASGYAEILCAEGATALLRLHAGGGHAPRQEHLYYAVVQDDAVVFVSEESDRAAERFDRLLTKRGSGGREDFLATMPLHLPTLRGAAYRRL